MIRSSTDHPPFNLTAAMVGFIAEISELLGYWSAVSISSSPQLRRENRIRSIHASLAIEHNTLSTAQISAIIDGKTILGPAREIQEVRNAIQSYEHIGQWQACKLDDLLHAHGMLMRGLVDDPGQLRSRGVGIYREQQLIHMAPPANQLPRLMSELLNWLAHTDSHPLIASCAFHYELEFIHPFNDGNGRMGRLWQTLILSQWRPTLAWLPVETLIHRHQNDYYRLLSEADRLSDCSRSIEFMLQALRDSLKESLHADAEPKRLSEKKSENVSEKTARPLPELAQALLNALAEDPYLTIAKLAQRHPISTRTVERQIKQLQAEQRLQRIGPAKGGYWPVNPAKVN